MLLLALGLYHIAVLTFLNDVGIDPIVWAGAFIGQGAYSGGRLVANAIASEGKLITALRRRTYGGGLMNVEGG